MDDAQVPLFAAKDYTAASLFEPVNLLREARRQRGLPGVPVPDVVVLDPDGDVVRHLRESGRGRLHSGWACYHTQMWTVDLGGTEVGVVGMAVGAPFAVLVAEQLAASGAQLVISVTSAGQLADLPGTPCWVLIERALRDEGTSCHYLPPGRWGVLASRLRACLDGALATSGSGHVVTGASWTTDAPYRETAAAIAAARDAGAVCVEMEAAALYAYAAARDRDVVCLAHVTNTMAVGHDRARGPHRPQPGVPAGAHRGADLHRHCVAVQRRREADRQGHLRLGLPLLQPGHPRLGAVHRRRRLEEDLHRPARGVLPARRAAELGFFGAFLTVAELAIGLGLVFGVATRLAAVGGLLLIGPIWLMLLHTGGYLWEYAAEDLFPLVLLAIVPAGRLGGLDRRLAPRFGHRLPF